MEKIKIEYYKPMAIKERIAEDVANAYFIYNIEGEVIDYSEIEKTKTLIYRLFEHYTNIGIPQITRDVSESDDAFILRAYDNEAQFIDKVYSDGSFAMLFQEIQSEIDIIESAVEAKIEFKKKKIEEENSFGKMVMKLLQSFLEKAPDSQQMQEVMDNLKNMDLSKMNDLMDLKKLIS